MSYSKAANESSWAGKRSSSTKEAGRKDPALARTLHAVDSAVGAQQIVDRGKQETEARKVDSSLSDAIPVPKRSLHSAAGSQIELADMSGRSSPACHAMRDSPSASASASQASETGLGRKQSSGPVPDTATAAAVSTAAPQKPVCNGSGSPDETSSKANADSHSAAGDGHAGDTHVIEMPHEDLDTSPSRCGPAMRVSCCYSALLLRGPFVPVDISAIRVISITLLLNGGNAATLSHVADRRESSSKHSCTFSFPASTSEQPGLLTRGWAAPCAEWTALFAAFFHLHRGMQRITSECAGDAKQLCPLCRGIEAEHPELCSNIMFICGMSARGRTEFYQPIVEHFCSIPDDTDPSKKLLTCALPAFVLVLYLCSNLHSCWYQQQRGDP